MAYLFAVAANNRNLFSRVLKAKKSKSKFWTGHTPCRGLGADPLPSRMAGGVPGLHRSSLSHLCALLFCAWVKSLYLFSHKDIIG